VEGWEIADRKLEPLGPEMGSGCALNELCSRAQCFASVADVAGDEVLDCEFLRDPLKVQRVLIVNAPQLGNTQPAL
jgi:hypothetical protein